MAQQETRIERRTRMLSENLTRRVDTVSAALRPPGDRPSFTQQLSERGALDWWVKNWNQPAGMAVLGQMDPLSRMELQTAMSQHIEQQALTPAAIGSSVFSTPPTA